MTALEKTTHVCLIALCCLAGGMLIEARFRAIRATQSTASDPAQSVAGRQLALPGADWAGANLNLVLVLSVTCQYCNESVPFYRTLPRLIGRQRRRVALIVATRDAVTDMRQHLQTQGITVDKVLHVSGEPLSSVPTPTIVAVGSDGIVKRVFVGRLDDAGESDVAKLVTRGEP